MWLLQRRGCRRLKYQRKNKPESRVDRTPVSCSCTSALRTLKTKKKVALPSLILSVLVQSSSKNQRPQPPRSRCQRVRVCSRLFSSSFFFLFLPFLPLAGPSRNKLGKQAGKTRSQPFSESQTRRWSAAQRSPPLRLLSIPLCLCFTPSFRESERVSVC